VCIVIRAALLTTIAVRGISQTRRRPNESKLPPEFANAAVAAELQDESAPLDTSFTFYGPQNYVYFCCAKYEILERIALGFGKRFLFFFSLI